ncbi:MAG: hypothetical protein R2681_01355 [Pyrinomonadaceae bacterium]
MKITTCKNCGATNLQNSAICSSCGSSLAAEISERSSGSADSKGSKLYWILGGLAALILIGGFFVVVLVAGIIFYTTSDSGKYEKKENEEVVKTERTETPEIKKPADDEKLFPDDGPAVSSKKITDQSVASVLEKRGNIGEFKFVMAKSQDGLSREGKKVFAFAEASAYATYLDTKAPDSKNSAALFAGYFSSPSIAKNDFDQSLRNSRSSGTKILSSGTKNGVHTALMNKNGAGLYLTCKERTCYLAVAPNRASLNRFVAGMAK